MKTYRSFNGSFAFLEASLEEVEKVFGDFKFDEAKFDFQANVIINNKVSGSPGFIIKGQINEKYDNEQVVKIFTKLMGLPSDKVLFEIK